MCTFECKVTQGCEKPWSSPHAAALSKSPQVPVKPTCRTSESDAMFELVPQRLKRSTPHERSSGPSSRCRPSYSAPATRANQPSRPREKEGEPCRVWEAIESIPGRLAPCREWMENSQQQTHSVFESTVLPPSDLFYPRSSPRRDQVMHDTSPVSTRNK